MSKGGRIMPGPLSRAERYQKVAAQYSDFAKTAAPTISAPGEIPIAVRRPTEKETAWRGRSHSGVSYWFIRTFATASLDSPGEHGGGVVASEGEPGLVACRASVAGRYQQDQVPEMAQAGKMKPAPLLGVPPDSSHSLGCFF
jgi:hypothetical protein